MTETMSLNQLARESGRSKTELKQLLNDGTLIGTQETHGNKRYLIERASAIAAGILPDPTQKPQPRHDGTIDTALRRTIADELQPVIALLTTRTADIEHTALTAAINLVDTTLQRIETMLHERLPADESAAGGPDERGPNSARPGHGIGYQRGRVGYAP